MKLREQKKLGILYLVLGAVLFLVGLLTDVSDAMNWLSSFGGAIAAVGAVEAVVAMLAGRSDLLSSLLITVPSALAYLLVTLPLMMKLGVEKGRFILLLLTLAFLLVPELIQ